VLIILLAAFALLFLAYPAARWTVGYIYGFTSELAHIALSGVWRLIRKPVIVAGLGTLLLAGSIASPLQVITFPRAGRHRRPSRSRRSDTLVPFSAAQMRVIARELSMAAPELLDAPKGTRPACPGQPDRLPRLLLAAQRRGDHWLSEITDRPGGRRPTKRHQHRRRAPTERPPRPWRRAEGE
jgi:hypothetical protein